MFLVVSLLALSAASLFTSFVARHRADAILSGLQRFDSVLATVENKLNSIHAGVQMQHELALSSIENEDAMKEAIEQMAGALSGEAQADDS